ncbi:MAG TPA: ATP-grasp domain-containing protein [Thermoleophilaceae bacterium]|nr:ATP-grasp domain-containing protein [Thermoleophilaceae bacterium]
MTYLFLDPGADAGRRDVYRLADSLNFGVTLIAPRPPADASGVNELIEANPTDPGEVLAATALVQNVEGVVNCSESCLRTQAALVERYRVPGINSQTAAVCRDKQLMARRFEEGGVPIARRRIVTSADEIPEAVEDVGCPGVLKPATGVASLFTVRFDSEQELLERFQQFDAEAREHRSTAIREMNGRWLVEEYLDGPAFSVESLTLGGETTHVAVCQKGEMTQPFFLETGHVCPAPLADDTRREMEEVAERAIRALGITDGITHSELKLTSRGIRVLEVGARMGGGSIRQVVRLATGVDLLEVTLELARGRKPEIAPATDRAAASRSWFPARPCTVRDLSRADELLELPGIVAVNRWTAEGERYQLPPDGYREVLGVVSVGDTPAEAIARAERAVAEAEQVVELEYDRVEELAGEEAA